MILAAVALVYPAAARLAGPLGLGAGAVLGTWLLPLAGILLHEGITRRRIHPVYLVGTGILVLAFGRLWVGETEAWLALGRGLLRVFGAG